MADKIEWLTNWDEAIGQAASLGKPVFLDFFNPG